MKKSIMNAKATAIATIEAAENIRKNMSYAEEMLVNSIIFQGVEDKDQEMEEEQTEMVYIPKKGWVKQSKKQYSRRTSSRTRARLATTTEPQRRGVVTGISLAWISS